MIRPAVKDRSLTPTEIQLINEVGDSNSSEPAVAVGLSTTVLAGVIYTLLKLILPNSADDILNGIALAVATLLPIIVGLIIRSKVWSPKSVQAVVSATVVKSHQAGYDTGYEKGRLIKEIKDFKSESSLNPPPTWGDPKNKEI